MPERSSRAAARKAVAHAGALLLVADLLEDVGQQILGLLVARLGIDQLVQNFLGMAVLPWSKSSLPLAMMFSAPPIIST